MERRSFLKGLGALLVTAPAIVKAESIMRINPHLVEASWRYVEATHGFMSVDGIRVARKHTVLVPKGYTFSCWVKTDRMSIDVIERAYERAIYGNLVKAHGLPFQINQDEPLHTIKGNENGYTRQIAQAPPTISAMYNYDIHQTSEAIVLTGHDKIKYNPDGDEG